MIKLLTTEQVAEIIHLTPAYTSRLIRRLGIGVKIGKRWLVKESDLERLLTRNGKLSKSREKN